MKSRASAFYSLFSIFYFLILTLYLLFSSSAEAASPDVYFELPNFPLTPGSEFTVKILIDSPLPLNAYEIAFHYPQSLLDVVSLDDSRSLIDVWQTPAFPEEGKIVFAGGSLTPFMGQAGELIAVRFRAKEARRAALAFETASVYGADGRGTKIAALAHDAGFIIKEGAESAGDAQSPDAAPPELSFVSLDPNPFNPAEQLLTFAAKDAGSGVKETLIRSRRSLLWGRWRSVQSPLPLTAGVWAIQIKVLDNAGNAASRLIYDWQLFAINVGAPLLAAVIFILSSFIHRKRKRNKGKVV